MRSPGRDQQGATPSIRMGEMAVAVQEGILQTLLGSCIGLALHDRKRKVGGLAHILLPRSNGKTDLPGKFVDTAIPTLIRRLEEQGGKKLELVAKIAGGASMFATQATNNIGLANLQASEQLLAELRIPIVASDCGGGKGRRMSLDVQTGSVTIQIVGCEPFAL